MADKRVPLSKMIHDGADVHLNNVSGDAPGYNASIDRWQLAMSYAILQELKKLNELLHCENFTGIPRTLKQIRAHTGRLPSIRKDR
jgi:hypothetical protein